MGSVLETGVIARTNGSANGIPAAGFAADLLATMTVLSPHRLDASLGRLALQDALDEKARQRHRIPAPIPKDVRVCRWIDPVRPISLSQWAIGAMAAEQDRSQASETSRAWLWRVR